MDFRLSPLGISGRQENLVSFSVKSTFGGLVVLVIDIIISPPQQHKQDSKLCEEVKRNIYPYRHHP